MLVGDVLIQILLTLLTFIAFINLSWLSPLWCELLCKLSMCSLMSDQWITMITIYFVRLS